MTRINLVDPGELTDAHLLDEHADIPAVFRLIVCWQARLRTHGTESEPPLPDAYTLETGHIRFFYDKAAWLAARHKALTAEIGRRGLEAEVSDPDTLMQEIDPAFQADTPYLPSLSEVAASYKRLRDRIRNPINPKAARREGESRADAETSHRITPAARPKEKLAA